VDFVLPAEYGLRNRLPGPPDGIFLDASGPSPIHDRLEFTANAHEQHWELGKPPRSVRGDLNVVEPDVHHDV
jgi:hypothetical protein